MGCILNARMPVRAYADADWTSDKDRKSTTGYLLQVYGATVCWVTKKQPTIALSSTEAEYVALAGAAAEVLWLKGLLGDFGINCDDPIVTYEDNQSCIHLLSKWEHRRLKHIDVKYNFIRDLYYDKVLDVVYIPTTSQIVDILTKGLTGKQFVKLRSFTGICSH